jgi:hypothetical protein
LNKRKMGEMMSQSMGLRLYRLLGVLEKSHGLARFDGLHRQVLNAVIEAQVAGKPISSQDIVDLAFTSRSSTYRKISDLKENGFLVDHWEQGICYVNLGPGCKEHFSKVDDILKVLAVENA